MPARVTKQHQNQLTIRDVPADVLELLRHEAHDHGMSLNAVVRRALSEHAERIQRRRQFAEALPLAAELRESIARRHGGPLDDSTPLIRRDRNR